MEQQQTLRQLREQLARAPDDVDLLNNMAWLLATAEPPALRNPAEAVRLAERANALTTGASPVVLDTLSTTYAAAGKRDKAIEAARQALRLAEAAGEVQMAESLRKQIAQFEAVKPG